MRRFSCRPDSDGVVLVPLLSATDSTHMHVQTHVNETGGRTAPQFVRQGDGHGPGGLRLRT